MLIADKAFVVEGSRKRTWECLTKALVRAMPFEQMDFVDERRFSALLRLRMGFIALPMRVKVEVIEMEEPEIMKTKTEAAGLRGLIQIRQMTTFTLKVTDDEKTEVVGKLEAENMSFPLRVFLIGKVRRFAEDSLDLVERFLKDWA